MPTNLKGTEMSLSNLQCFLYLVSSSIIVSALTGVAQWIEYQPAKQRVVDLIPSQGMCLGFRPGPQ